MKKKKSVVGWTYRGWKLEMHRAQARIPNIFPAPEEVYYDMAYRPAKKVRITIEEL